MQHPKVLVVRMELELVQEEEEEATSRFCLVVVQVAEVGENAS